MKCSLPKKPLNFLMQSLQFLIPGMDWGIGRGLDAEELHLNTYTKTRTISRAFLQNRLSSLADDTVKIQNDDIGVIFLILAKIRTNM
jgi:hypothetical protein